MGLYQSPLLDMGDTEVLCNGFGLASLLLQNLRRLRGENMGKSPWFYTSK
jgi:hypothetical protein